MRNWFKPRARLVHPQAYVSQICLESRMRLVVILSIVTMVLPLVDVAGQDRHVVDTTRPATRPESAATAVIRPQSEPIDAEGVTQAERLLRVVAKAARTAESMTDSLRVEIHSDWGGQSVQELTFEFGPAGTTR